MDGREKWKSQPLSLYYLVSCMGDVWTLTLGFESDGMARLKAHFFQGTVMWTNIYEWHWLCGKPLPKASLHEIHLKTEGWTQGPNSFQPFILKQVCRHSKVEVTVERNLYISSSHWIWMSIFLNCFIPISFDHRCIDFFVPINKVDQAVMYWQYGCWETVLRYRVYFRNIPTGLVCLNFSQDENIT